MTNSACEWNTLGRAFLLSKCSRNPEVCLPLRHPRNLKGQRLPLFLIGRFWFIKNILGWSCFCLHFESIGISKIKRMCGTTWLPQSRSMLRRHQGLSLTPLLYHQSKFQHRERASDVLGLIWKWCWTCESPDRVLKTTLWGLLNLDYAKRKCLIRLAMTQRPKQSISLS